MGNDYRDMPIGISLLSCRVLQSLRWRVKLSNLQRLAFGEVPMETSYWASSTACLIFPAFCGVIFGGNNMTRTPENETGLVEQSLGDNLILSAFF